MWADIPCMSEDERLERITSCCLKMEHCRRRQKDPKYADCSSTYKDWELDWLRELHILLYTPERCNPHQIFHDKSGVSRAGPEDDDADVAGVPVEKPKRPNLNSGSAAASLDQLLG
jgi:hypothetical protein